MPPGTRSRSRSSGPTARGRARCCAASSSTAAPRIPEWLTVSARRETFELNAVDVGDLTFTDAPGFAAGNELHDELAQDALALSDAFLLVVPPQLLTTNRELVGSILSGRYFFGEPRPGVDRVIRRGDRPGRLHGDRPRRRRGGDAPAGRTQTSPS